MPSLLYLALSNAVLATLLAAFAAVVTRLCRRPSVRHALWLLVLLKLITPPLVPISVSWPGGEEREPLPAEMPPSDFVLPEPLADTANGRRQPAGEELHPSAERTLYQPADAGRSPHLFWIPFLIVIWLGGALAWWTVAFLRLRRFRRLLRQAQPAAADVQEQGRRLAVLLGLRRCPPIVFTSAPLSPMLWALGFSPCLLLPTELWRKLTAEQQDTLLAHELAHLRRGDQWVRRLELLVLGLYWWHPVVWWARRRLQEAEEECCDALVVALLPDAAPAYAAALVETVAFLSQTRPAALVGASGAGQVPLLKRRLTMILTETSSRKPSRFGFWIVLGLGALLLPLAPQMARLEALEKSKGVEATSEPGALDFGFPVVKLSEEDPHKLINCASCHEPVPVHRHDFHGKPKSWQHAHDEVARLLDELRNQRAQLQKTEALLKRTLDAMQQMETPAKPLVKANWNVTWAEALFDQRRADLGTLRQGTIMEHGFRMTNHGQHPVHIASVRTSAGCLSASPSAVELPPKGNAEIAARLDTSRFVGDKTFKVFVQFDKPDRQEVVLEIHTNVEPAVSVKPQSPERLQELEKKLDELRKEMEKLRREMPRKESRGPEQEYKELRGFIVFVWPTLDTAHLEENIPKAQKAFQMLKADGDLRSLRKLLTETEGHVARLTKELAKLHPELVIEDEREAKKLKKVLEQIAELDRDIKGYLMPAALGR